MRGGLELIRGLRVRGDHFAKRHTVVGSPDQLQLVIVNAWLRGWVDAEVTATGRPAVRRAEVEGLRSEAKASAERRLELVDWEVLHDCQAAVSDGYLYGALAYARGVRP